MKLLIKLTTAANAVTALQIGRSDAENDTDNDEFQLVEAPTDHPFDEEAGDNQFQSPMHSNMDGAGAGSRNIYFINKIDILDG